MITLSCAVCGSKKSKFIKKQEASSSLSNLIIRTPLSQISLVGTFCFKGVTKLMKNIKWTKQ